MKILREISENEMIATFLKAEMKSDRWSPTLLSILRRDGKDKELLTHPNINSKEENEYRKEILGGFRGYGRDEKLFGTFPTGVAWARGVISKEEFEKILFIDWDYWTDVTDGTRSPKYLAKKILAGDIPADEEIERLYKVAEVIKSGKKLTEMILVAIDEDSQLVVLEGHVRLAAYFLVPERIPDEMEVIVGFSEKMEDWSEY